MNPVLLVATFLGVGRVPFAPGTVASILTVFICYFIDLYVGWPGILFFCAVATILGFGVSGSAAERLGDKDPSCVVIDEVAGMALAGVSATGNPVAFAVAFAGFRVLDIWKPGPVGRAEKLGGGTGIMADDLVAGLLVMITIGVVRIILKG